MESAASDVYTLPPTNWGLVLLTNDWLVPDCARLAVLVGYIMFRDMTVMEDHTKTKTLSMGGAVSPLYFYSRKLIQKYFFIKSTTM